MDLVHTLVGFLVGLIVGFTGVGGGSLMAPILILLLGVAPITAVGTDLWFAAITKIVGGVIHYKKGGASFGPDFQVIKRLCIGSLPAAAIVILMLSRIEIHQIKGGLIMNCLGVVLIATAIATLFRGYLHRIATNVRLHAGSGYRRYQIAMTVVAGAILGILVTLTSVGAGALGATMLLALYPLRMNTRRLVATDIVHAVPLMIVAGAGHFWIGDVDMQLLASLLVGSIPGIVLGSLLTAHVSEKVLGPSLSAILLITGTKLLFN